jgi:predicted DNA-binding WGR domain protein
MDVRDTLPAWVRYAEYIGGGSDKYYELRIDMLDTGQFQMTARWGRRPDQGSGQTKVYDVVANMQIATGHANALYQAKLAKGYRPAERPARADQFVAKDSSIEDDPYEGFEEYEGQEFY